MDEKVTFQECLSEDQVMLASQFSAIISVRAPKSTCLGTHSSKMAPQILLMGCVCQRGNEPYWLQQIVYLDLPILSLFITHTRLQALQNYFFAFLNSMAYHKPLFVIGMSHFQASLVGVVQFKWHQIQLQFFLPPLNKWPN